MESTTVSHNTECQHEQERLTYKSDQYQAQKLN